MLSIIVLLILVSRRLEISAECTGNYPLMSGLHFSVLDYQITSNSDDTNCYSSSQFGENSPCEVLWNYEARIGADHYRGWCSNNGDDERYLQVDFGREVIVRRVETQGFYVNDEARYIQGFWLAYSTSVAIPFTAVVETTSNTTKMFSGQTSNDITTSVFQDLPYPISARIVRLYPMSSERACVKLELHGCVPQREEECQSVYQLSCCTFGQTGDLINSVVATSQDQFDPIEYIVLYNELPKFWCADRNDPFPIYVTFYLNEEVLLTSVRYHGLDGPTGDDYVTRYSWEYSVATLPFRTYTDLNNMSEFVNNREDKFQQTFWNPIRVQTLRFVILGSNIRPCIAFQFFGCKITGVTSISNYRTSTNSVLSPTISSSTTPLIKPTVTSDSFAATVSSSTIVDHSMTVAVSSPSPTQTLPTVMVSVSPTPSTPASRCYGNGEALISGTRYYVSDDQLSASGFDPLHYSYDNMNERVILRPEEGRIASNVYSSYLGWCSEIVTNIVNNAPYIQVEFGTNVVISGGAIQGIKIENHPRYVTRFQLAFMELESEEFCVVNDETRNPMIFQGSNGDNYPNEIMFTIPTEVRGRIFRLYPLNWTSIAVDGSNTTGTGRACLKWELYGCAELESEESHHCQPDQADEFNDLITMITSNSNSEVAESGLLRYQDDNDHWCPSVEGVDLPLVISFNFDEEVIITSMVIVGRETREEDKFITSYSLSYTNGDMCNLTQYKDLFGRSVFHNNHVRPFFHSFWEPIHVRQLQLLIIDWHVTPCLSVGLFGCRNSEAVSDSSSVDGTFDGVCTAPPNDVLLTCVNVDKKIISIDDDNAAIIVAIVLPIILILLLVTIVTVLLWMRFRKKFRKNHYDMPTNSIQSENPLYEQFIIPNKLHIKTKTASGHYDKTKFGGPEPEMTNHLKSDNFYTRMTTDIDKDGYNKLDHQKEGSEPVHNHNGTFYEVMTTDIDKDDYNKLDHQTEGSEPVHNHNGTFYEVIDNPNPERASQQQAQDYVQEGPCKTTATYEEPDSVNN